MGQTRDASSSGAVFLSPHNDDETLFGSFTLLRERPRVITILRSQVQERRGTGVTYQQREAENAAALEVLGITDWEQWTYADDDPPWSEIRERLAAVQADHVYAPAVERRGHAHHNAIGELANAVWPGNVTFYTTYTTWGRTKRGDEVQWEHEWVLLKLRALSCYRSQILVPGTWTTHHFLAAQAEYYAARSSPVSSAVYWAADTSHLLRSALAGTSARVGRARSSADR